ncbi:MAG: NUDIX domain-containing protein [Bdellovibrio sp.]
MDRPQGGIEGIETPIEALYREMQEETGIVDVKVIRDSGVYISYLWPQDAFPDSKFIGQEHIYFLINGTSIDIEKLTATEEFSSFGWFTIEESLNAIVKLKKAAYQQAFQILELLK